jgi:hypothetical protein
MSESRDAQNLVRIRRAIRHSKEAGSRPTLNTIVRDTGLNIGVVQRLVRRHQLAVAWRARDTIEAESISYLEAIEKFREFCDGNGVNFRRALITSLASYQRRWRASTSAR